MNKKILVVTQDSTITDTLRLKFGEDYTIEGCKGSKLEDKIRLSKPQAVILDSASQGVKFSRKLHYLNQPPTFSIILLAEVMSPRLMLEAYKAGVNYYILKQPGYEALVLTLRSIFSLEAHQYLCA
jgi:DNA-binding NarL/FixJ family response regulator